MLLYWYPRNKENEFRKALNQARTDKHFVDKWKGRLIIVKSLPGTFTQLDLNESRCLWSRTLQHLSESLTAKWKARRYRNMDKFNTIIHLIAGMLSFN